MMGEGARAETRGFPVELGPDELDGHTLDELSDYLDAGRQPVNPGIEQSAGCRIALEAMERVRGLAPQLAESDEGVDEGWVSQVLANIALDARTGRRIPVSAVLPGGDLAVSEGAVRGLIRGAETVVPGALIGRCGLDGDVEEPGAIVRVSIDASLPYGRPVLEAAELLRSEIAARLAAHTELRVESIDVRVRDVRLEGDGAPEAERSGEDGR